MSTATAHASDHHDGHEHHVSSMFVLLGVFVVLLIMTVLTVYTAKFVDLGETGNFILAMAIASFKASLVCAFFMHLLHDSKFNAVVLLYCLLTLALFILFTKIDLDSRGAIDPRRVGPIEKPAMVEEHYDPEKAAASHNGEGGDHGGDDAGH